MKLHAICGEAGVQYQRWSQSIADQQRLDYQVKKQMSSIAKTSKCRQNDQIPLTLGHTYWDYNKESFRAVRKPPTTSNDNTTFGPHILIIGAMKCGTNTIATLLSHHPYIKLNLCPTGSSEGCNINTFQGNYNINSETIESIWENPGLSFGYMRNPSNYIGRFSRKLPFNLNDSKSFTFDKSPTYLKTNVFPNIAQRTHQLLPNAKIVVTVCNPVERIYAEYNHIRHRTRFFEYEHHNVRVPRNFSEFISDMHDSSSIGYRYVQFSRLLRRLRLDHGRYVNHIQRWRQFFGKENVLILNMEDSNYEKVKQILSFVGDCLPENKYPWGSVFTNNTKHQELISYKNDKYSGRSSGYSDHKEAFRWLYGYYLRANIELSKEIDHLYPLEWNKKLPQLVS